MIINPVGSLEEMCRENVQQAAVFILANPRLNTFSIPCFLLLNLSSIVLLSDFLHRNDQITISTRFSPSIPAERFATITVEQSPLKLIDGLYPVL
jgi:hypothetical protein